VNLNLHSIPLEGVEQRKSSIELGKVDKLIVEGLNKECTYLVFSEWIIEETKMTITNGVLPLKKYFYDDQASNVITINKSELKYTEARTEESMWKMSKHHRAKHYFAFANIDSEQYILHGT